MLQSYEYYQTPQGLNPVIKTEIIFDVSDEDIFGVVMNTNMAQEGGGDDNEVDDAGLLWMHDTSSWNVEHREWKSHWFFACK